MTHRAAFVPKREFQLESREAVFKYIASSSGLG